MAKTYAGISTRANWHLLSFKELAQISTHHNGSTATELDMEEAAMLLLVVMLLQTVTNKAGSKAISAHFLQNYNHTL